MPNWTRMAVTFEVETPEAAQSALRRVVAALREAAGVERSDPEHEPPIRNVTAYQNVLRVVTEEPEKEDRYGE